MNKLKENGVITMNNVNLIGNLTRDVELRYTATQVPVANFTIAINRPKKADGTNDADYIRIKVFNKQAETCDAYLSKGSKVGISGHLVSGSYEKDGEKRYTLEVVADRVEFLTAKGQKQEQPVADLNTTASNNWEAIADEDIPF